VSTFRFGGTALGQAEARREAAVEVHAREQRDRDPREGPLGHVDVAASREVCGQDGDKEVRESGLGREAVRSHSTCGGAGVDRSAGPGREHWPRQLDGVAGLGREAEAREQLHARREPAEYRRASREFHGLDAPRQEVLWVGREQDEGLAGELGQPRATPVESHLVCTRD
jgi:hypothetical protein